MIIGQTLHALNGSPATTTYYTPWFSRGGNLLGVAADIIQFEDIDTFIVVVETKNSEQDDKAASALKTENITPSIGIHKFKAGVVLSSGDPGVLELVRYRFDLSVTSSETDGWIHVRMLNPTWLTN